MNTRTFDAGFFTSFKGGRIGRKAKLPPQLGQRPPSLFSTQSRQNVHSNVQIMASVADGGRSLLQHSQFGRNSSLLALLRSNEAAASDFFFWLGLNQAVTPAMSAVRSRTDLTARRFYFRNCRRVRRNLRFLRSTVLLSGKNIVQFQLACGL